MAVAIDRTALISQETAPRSLRAPGALPRGRIQCLIVAAGRGARLGDSANIKPLVPLGGLPLIERAILASREAGADEFLVVTGCGGEALGRFLHGLAQRRGIRIATVSNPDWESGNLSSLAAARGHLEEPFLLMMADHLFAPAIIGHLLAAQQGRDEVLIAADMDPAGNHIIDPAEATKLLVQDGRVLDIGKDIPRYNAYDTGFFLCSNAVFQAAEEVSAAGGTTIADAMRTLTRRGKVRAVDVTGLTWLDVDFPRDLRNAEALLRRSLAKPEDGLVSRALNRPLSTRVTTPLLLRLFPAVTANHVSLLGFLVSAAAALTFALRQPLAGGVLIHLASVLDGSDGEIARLRKQESGFGKFLDAVLDRYSDGLILFGMLYFMLSAGQNADLFGRYWLPLAWGAGLLAVLGTLMVSYTSAKSVTDIGYRYSGGLIAAGRGRDLRLFILTLGALAAVIHPVSVFLALAAVGLLANGVVLGRMWLSWRLARSPVATVRAVIFDLDGTLADTMTLLTRTAVSLIREIYGLPAEEARDRYVETTGLDFASQLERIFPGRPENATAAAGMREAKNRFLLECSPFADVPPSLAFLKERGVQCFAVSSTEEPLVRRYIQDWGLDGLLDGYSGFAPGFDKGRQIDEVLNRYGLQPWEVLFVGDSLMDCEFVRNRGVRFAGIRRLFPAQAFRERGAMSMEDLGALTRLWRGA